MRSNLVLFLIVQCATTTAFIGHCQASFRSNHNFELQAKQKFKINTNVSGDVSSDGLLADKKKEQLKNAASRSAVESNLGVSNKRKMPSNSGSIGGGKKLSKKAQNLAEQRKGDVDSTLQAGISLVGDQDVQIVEAKRGAKRVTLLQGLTSTMEDRKKLLKELKSKLGGGGAMIEGVVSLISCSCFSIRYIHHYPIADV